LEKELLHLAINGELPIEGVDSLAFTPAGLPLYNTVAYMLKRGDKPPLNYEHIKKICQTKYDPKKDTFDLLEEVASYVPEPTVLETIHQHSILRRLMDESSNQLATGVYDLSVFQKYLDMGGSGVVDDYIKTVAPPEHGVDATYMMQTNIPQLDALVKGLNDELVIVAARPKHGKSNFFVNLVNRNPDKRVLYITVADYGYADVCNISARLNPDLARRDNYIIADFNSFGATVVDIESAIKKVMPDLLIVDRAEELEPIKRSRETRWDLKAIFKRLRQLAKLYKIPVFTDSQVSAQNIKETADKKFMVTPADLAEDRTQRQAYMDLFIGLWRRMGEIQLDVFGRRPGLPENIFIRTDPEGRYLDAKPHPKHYGQGNESDSVLPEVAPRRSAPVQQPTCVETRGRR
jgi:hypothetical protein